MQVHPAGASPGRYGGSPAHAIGGPQPYPPHVSNLATVPLGGNLYPMGGMGVGIPQPIVPPPAFPMRGAEVVVNVIDLPRPRWKSRASFVCAVLGTLIGLGNWWRFPDIMNRYGGGPFLITYFLSIGIIGIPLMYLEIGLGQRMQRSAIAAFGAIHPRVRGVGFVSVIAGFIVASYYMAIVGLSALYFVESWYKQLPWGWTTEYNPPSEVCRQLFPHKGLYHYNVEVTKMFTREFCEQRSMWDSDGIAWHWWGAITISWVLLLVVLCKGVRSLSYVTFIATGIPFALLIVLFVRGVSMGGVPDGAHWYVQRWEWKALLHPGLWVESGVQVFMTLAVCLSILPAYGSYNPRDSPQLFNIILIAILNFIFSFLAGFAIFGTLGHLAVEASTAVSHLALSDWRLAFVSHPIALSAIAGPNVWNVLLFILLFLLGLHAVVGLVLGVAAAICDVKWGRRTFGEYMRTKWSGWSEFMVIFLVAFAAWVPSFLWASDVGMMWIVAVHHWVQNYLLLVIGLVEAFVIAWVWGAVVSTNKVNRKSSVWFTLAFTFAIIAFAVVAVAAAVDLAPCVETAWLFNDGSINGRVISCGKYDAVCEMRTIWLNEQKYYAASSAVWNTCPAWPTVPLAGSVGNTQLLTPASDASPCVLGVVQNDCRVGGELPIAIAVGLVVLIVFWYVSWSKSRVPVKRWWGSLCFAGTDQIVRFYSWSERLRVPSAMDVPLGLGLGGKDFVASLIFFLWSFFVKFVIPPLLLVLLLIVFKWDVRDPPLYAPGLVQLVMWLMVGLPWLGSAMFLLSSGVGVVDPAARDVQIVEEFDRWINMPPLPVAGGIPPQVEVVDTREPEGIIRI